MTRVYDVEQLIGEEASGPVERQALGAVTRRLQGALESDVPYRPQFKSQLRQHLVGQARRQMRPWYRRPAVWGSGVAMAAAAAVLVVGLNLWQTGRVQPPSPPNQVVEVPPEPAAPDMGTGPAPTFRVSLPNDLQVVRLPDDAVAPEGSPNLELSDTPTSVAGGLQLKQLTARPSEADFRSMANQLAFRGEGRRSAAGWAITEENRSLSLTTDGEVVYADTSPVPSSAAESVDAQGATQAARSFLDQTLLPVVSQPAVSEERDGFTIVYTEKVEGRPVVNAETVIEVNLAGRVRRAKAYLASGVATHTTYGDVLTEPEALEEAARQGGRFDWAELVWVRTPGDGIVYLQPYWRAHGTDSQGREILRYVAALKR